MWKEHFKNLIGNSPKVTDRPITKIIDDQQGQLTQEELNLILAKVKSRKAAGLNEIPLGIWKTRKFDDILIWFCDTVYNQNTIKKRTKGCIIFSEKGDLKITKIYRGITLISITANVYNVLLLNRIETEIEKILWKNQNSFGRNRSTTLQNVSIRWIMEGVLSSKKALR